jgi:lipoprotein signal peptidase
MAGSSALRAAETEYRKAALVQPKKTMPWPWYAAAVLFFVADRALKYLALSHKTIGEGGPAAFTLFMNTGIAFSLPVPAAVFWPAAAIAMAIIVWSFMRSLRRDPAGAAALFVVLCGAISNLFDRARYDATVDYFLFFGRSAVNVADGLIVGGLLYLLLRKKEKSAT